MAVLSTTHTSGNSVQPTISQQDKCSTGPFHMVQLSASGSNNVYLLIDKTLCL
jgi:hypothetical protein